LTNMRWDAYTGAHSLNCATHTSVSGADSEMADQGFGTFFPIMSAQLCLHPS
jgi:hypothetical protein